MKNRLVILVLAVLVMLVVFYTAGTDGTVADLSPTLVIGFMIISSFVIGYFFENLGLPKITGYIISGLLFGPFILKFYSRSSVDSLLFLNSLALAFIAFNAGSELRIGEIVKNIRPISSLTFGVIVVVFAGVTAAVFLLSGTIPFMKHLPFPSRIAVSSIFGVISVARSPSSTIAIINETGSRGSYTSTILSSTVITDVIIIILFALVISVSTLLMQPGGRIGSGFLLFLIVEIFTALLLGFILGKFIVFLINKVKVEFSVVILALGFFVIKFTHFAGSFISDRYEMNINIEPLLICMAAGFTVQNFSGFGDIFLKRMDKISLPVYVTFFTITGASINLDILKDGWFLGLLLFFTRTLMIYLGSGISARAAQSERKIIENSWLGFITQAGISLGLLAEVMRRFPEIGIHIQSIMIAAISLNQILGPVAFKFGLTRAEETARIKRRTPLD